MNIVNRRKYLHSTYSLRYVREIESGKDDRREVGKYYIRSRNDSIFKIGDLEAST